MDPLNTLKDISALVKKYNDLELMRRIVDLQQEVFDLQQTNLDLQKQIAALRESRQAEGSMIPRPPFNYYYRDGDPVPFCPKCWENDKKPIHLPESEPWSGGIRRDCRVCNETYWEKPPGSGPARIGRTRSSRML